MDKKTKKSSCSCCCDKHDYQKEIKKDLKIAATEAKQLAQNVKNKYDQMTPAQKAKLKKNVAIGGAVIAGLWGLGKMFGGKKK